MSSLQTDHQDVRTFLRSATDAAATALHAPAPDAIIGLGAQRIRRRRLAAAGSGLAALAIVTFGTTALGGGFHRADLRPAQSTSSAADPMRPGTVKVVVPRNAGADTTYVVSIFPDTSGGHVYVQDGTGTSENDFAPGFPIEGATPDIRLVILPADAVSADLLPAAPTGGVISSGPTRVPGTAWSVMAFRYDFAPTSGPATAIWFRADGTPVTRSGAGSVVDFGEVKVWLDKDADRAGLSVDGNRGAFAMAGHGPLNAFEMSKSPDAKTWFIGGFIEGPATNIRATLDKAGQRQLGDIRAKPIPGTAWTAFVIQVMTGGPGPAATITWTGADGQQHSGRA